jgi:hypothetical protein
VTGDGEYSFFNLALATEGSKNKLTQRKNTVTFSVFVIIPILRKMSTS